MCVESCRLHVQVPVHRRHAASSRVRAVYQQGDALARSKERYKIHFLSDFFRHFQNVIAGIRPECQAHFDEDCWFLMEKCWTGEARDRPHVGALEPILKGIFKRFQASPDHKLHKWKPRRDY